MELFIKIKDGQPFEHPIFGDNFRQVFPDVDTNNLPPEFAKFERVDRPEIGIYEIYQGVTYELVGNVYKDVHHTRAMTAEEKTEIDMKIAEASAKCLPLIGVTRV
jgi:hypothetical protein